MKKYDHVKRTLETRLKELLLRAESIETDLAKPPSNDWEERATETEGDEVMEHVGDLALKEISQIKNALERLEQGVYGTCVSCGSDIGLKRLEVLPHAIRCLECKSDM